MAEFGIHHYQGTSSHAVEDWVSLLGPLLAPEADDFRELFCPVHPGQAGHMKGYKNVVMGPHNAKIYYGSRRDDCHVVLCGETCEALGLAGLRSIIDGKLTLKPTRIDVAFDGVIGPDGKQLSPVWVKHLIRNDHRALKTYCKLAPHPEGKYPQGEAPESWRYAESANGETCYIGSKSNEQSVRVYNKRGFARIELQLRGKRAVWALECFVEKSSERIATTSLMILRRFVEFVDSDTRTKHYYDLQPWWAAFVGEPVGLKEFPRKLPTSVERATAWAFNGVSRTLAAVAGVTNDPIGFVIQILDFGRVNMNDKGRALMATVGKAKRTCDDLFNASRDKIRMAVGTTIDDIKLAASKWQPELT